MHTHTSHSLRLLLLAGVSFLAALFFSLYPNNLFFPSLSKKQSSHTTIPTITPTVTPTPTIGVPTLTPTKTPTPTPTRTPTPTPSATTPVTTLVTTVNIQILEPDGNFSLTVTLHDGNTVCDSLTEAKQEGKIKSVTIDDSYMASLHSAYVKEINGFANNWTFTVNGQSPKGCSLYSPKSGDTIVWKFG